MQTLKFTILASVVSAAFTAPVMAYTTGDFILRGGSATVAPKNKSDNIHAYGNNGASAELNAQASANNDTQLGLSFTYMMTDKLGIEVLAATPFSHDLNGKGDLEGSDLGTIKHLPPTVSLQYYPMSQNSQWQPYVGAGVNYTTFFSEETSRAMEADGYDSLSLDDSWGLSAQVGMDYLINKNWGVNVSAMYIDLKTTATLGGEGKPELKGDYDLNPMVYRVNAVYRF